MRVIYFNARGSRHILGGDFRLFQSGSHLLFLRLIDLIYQNMRLNEKIFTRPERQSVVVSEGVEGLEVNHSVHPLC